MSKIETTVVYKVYGCNDEGKPILWAEFLDLRPACRYAVANYGKIHYNLPEVEQVKYVYDPDFQVVASTTLTIVPAQIHYMNKI